MKKRYLTHVILLLISHAVLSQEQQIKTTNGIPVDSVIAHVFGDNYDPEFRLKTSKPYIVANNGTVRAEYTYYSDGALKSDSRRGISLILYDTFLDKIKEIQFTNGKVMRFFYDGTGRLLKRTFTGGDTWVYSGDMVYKNGKFFQMSIPEGRMINNNGTWEKQFYYLDQVGNNRVIYRSNNGKLEVVQRTDYDPFGMELGNSTNGDPKEIFKFQGKEKIDELGWNNFGNRMYDPQIGRFLSVDPMASHPQQFGISPYAAFNNNPINMIDPDGRIPYPITIRAFAPFNTFGGFFHGDGATRGYTTSSLATARIHQIINFDTDRPRMTTNAWSSPTSHILSPFSMVGTPSVAFNKDYTLNVNGNSKTFNFGTHVAGSNPMFPSAPPIDVFSNFSITENKKTGTLSISGKLTGDNFPSTEAFISDPSGNNVFIAVGYYVGSPFSSLGGENHRNISNFSFSITTDKKGNFTGVKFGGKSYSIAEWNDIFQTADPHKNQEKK